MEISLSLADTKDASLAKFISSVLYDGLSAKQYADNLIDEEETGYQEAMEEYPEMALSATGNWEYQEVNEVTVKGSYAIIARTIYEYYGGAHGNTVIEYFVIDTKTPELIMLDNIVAEANVSKLEDIVGRELKAYLESIDFYDEDYFSFEMYEYYPTGDGLCFAWNPYEVAAYAAGPVNVVITWKEAEDLLNSKGKALAKAFK
jgi:hypothetical protein